MRETISFSWSGGAILARPGRCRGCVRWCGWSGTTERDGVASGRQVRRATHVLREQDGALR